MTLRATRIVLSIALALLAAALTLLLLAREQIGDVGPPIANDDFAVTTAGVSVTVRVLENDTAPSKWPLTVVDMTVPPGAKIVHEELGQISIQPREDFVGDLRLRYTVQSSSGDRDEAVVTVVVLPPGALVGAPDVAPTRPPILWGVNLFGLEFGDPRDSGSHGRINREYVAPTEEEFDYFVSKGMHVLRIPFKWERVQHCIGCDLDDEDTALLAEVARLADASDALVIFDLHNYGRYFDVEEDEYLEIGSQDLPPSALADFWGKFAARFGGVPGVYGYGLMNEPHDLSRKDVAGSDVWFEAAQQSIDAIREHDELRPIIVPGYAWSSALNWPDQSGLLSELEDPAENLIFEAHLYLDEDSSGAYEDDCRTDGATILTGVERLIPFIEWLRENRLTGMIGEVGVPEDACWLEVLGGALRYLAANAEQIRLVQYWAAGPWGWDYQLSVQPILGPDGTLLDRPQLKLLLQHAGLP